MRVQRFPAALPAPSAPHYSADDPACLPPHRGIVVRAAGDCRASRTFSRKSRSGLASRRGLHKAAAHFLPPACRAIPRESSSDTRAAYWAKRRKFSCCGTGHRVAQVSHRRSSEIRNKCPPKQQTSARNRECLHFAGYIFRQSTPHVCGQPGKIRAAPLLRNRAAADSSPEEISNRWRLTYRRSERQRPQSLRCRSDIESCRQMQEAHRREWFPEQLRPMSRGFLRRRARIAKFALPAKDRGQPAEFDRAAVLRA